MFKGKGLTRREFLKSSAAALGGLSVLRIRAFGDEAILVGAAVSQTGKYERSGFYTFQGYKLGQSLVNQAGGVQGRPLELVIYDDQSDPSGSVKLYQKLIVTDEVDLLLGPYSSAVTKAVVPVIEQFEVPMVTCMAADPRIWEGQNIRWSVQMISSARLYLVGALEVANEKAGAQKLAMVVEDTAFPTAVAEGLRAKAQELELEIVLDEVFPADFTDWTTLAAKARDAGAEIFAGGAYFPAAVGLTKACAAVGYEPTLQSWTVGVTAADFVDAVGEDLAECVSGNAHWLDTVKTKGFLTEGQELTNEQFIAEFNDVYGRDPDYHAAGGFGAVQFLAEAINASLNETGEVDRAFIRDYIFNTETETVFGVYGVVPDGPDAGLQQRKGNFIAQWQRGTDGLAMEVIWPANAATAEPCFG